MIVESVKGIKDKKLKVKTENLDENCVFKLR